MKIYFGGVVPGKGGPNNDKIGREQDLARICQENGGTYRRMVSFAYPEEAKKTIEALKKMQEDE